VKRTFDIVVVLLALIAFSLPIICLYVLVFFLLGRPVLFAQVRPGINGKPFRMYKFRSMTDERDSDGNLLPDSARLTKFGSLLRSSSLDELPGLWNVLKGDMSLVGPRPLLMEYLALYNAEQFRRHEVKPGITGWAQVNGRNAISWSDKFKLDVWYVDNQSFWLDIKILLMTIKKVFIREGINAHGQATMEKFTGND
jgi:Sugar transferases involved in lipopolysaccharide synthesis